MRKFIETTGRSEEDAISAALFQGSEIGRASCRERV